MMPFLRVTAFWGSLLALIALTIYSRFARTAREDGLEQMRLGMEDVASRVYKTSENVKLVRKYADAAALAKARALARIIADNPSVVTNQTRLEAITRLLDVDEIHISDPKGILVAGVPTDYIGLDMSQTDQTRPFMEALTNPKFEFAQEPMTKGFARGNVRKQGLFQYIGVARIDQPGILQVGQRASRVAQAQKLADVGEIRKTARIGRSGRVSIRPIGNLPPPKDGFRRGLDGDGRRIVALETDCAGYRIFISMPDDNRLLGNAWTFRILLALCGLFIVVPLALLSRLRKLFREDLQAIRTLLASSRGGTFRRAVGSPVALVCMVAFACVIAACWGVTARTSLIKATEMLKAAAQDMRENFETNMDLPLFYMGQSICRHYKSPENMSTEAVQDVMKRYGLDELNVVNADGKIVIGALADVGYDMGSKPKTAEFNCLLNGEKTYSQPFRGAVEDPTIRRKYAGIAFPPPAKGYIQIGFAEERVKDDIDYWYEEQAVGWHIGETGYYIIAKEETGVIDSCGLESCEKGATLAGIGFDVTSAPKKPDEFFTATLFGKKCLCLTEVRSFHRIVTVLPLAEVYGSARRIVIVTAVFLVAVLILVIVFLSRLSDKNEQLQGYITAEKERQLKDLTLAKTIQTSALPFSFPNEPDFKIFATMTTAREVGGDFYDFYERPDGKIVFLVADVSGKGVPAALFMMRAKTMIRAAVFERPDSISSAVALANDNLAEHNDAEMFVTAWIGVLDRATGEVAFVNAGHNPPLIRRADGSVEWVRGKGGLVLAAMAGVPYRSGRCQLGKGDSLFLYTDGVTEAMSVTHEQYGEPRLEAALAKSGPLFVNEIGASVAKFTAGAEQSDDITMLALDRF